MGRGRRGSVSIDRREHLIRVYGDIFLWGWHIAIEEPVYIWGIFLIGLGVLFLLLACYFFKIVREVPKMRINASRVHL